MSDELEFKPTPDLRQQLFSALTGRPGDVSGKPGGGLVGKLAAAFGPGRRGAPVNTKAAAEALGVTQRTVQRWVSGAIRNPRADHARAITKRARQAASTKAGRRKALQGARGDRASRFGATISIRGNQGPYGDPTYARWRWAHHKLTPDQVEQMRAAYEAGGDTGALKWLQQSMGDPEPGVGYVEDWTIYEAEELRIDPR